MKIYCHQGFVTNQTRYIYPGRGCRAPPRAPKGYEESQRRLKLVQGELTPLEVMRSMEGRTRRSVMPRACSVLSSESTPQKMRKESAGRSVDPRRPK